MNEFSEIDLHEILGDEDYMQDAFSDPSLQNELIAILRRIDYAKINSSAEICEYSKVNTKYKARNYDELISVFRRHFEYLAGAKVREIREVR